ncbi:septation protein A [Azospira inquinata]|uniref:Inner membrane-spanning protein YciB n=1 Tax=Azospira inquinata TaxID=2785627 RepID=A0A975SN70_9RHOO|nr:septation protein A [Azospira inquinata]QWT45310.1 septation protein A [Azospira inquinata]QWT49358.1 septation protein A [Azospira inquinata]
MKFLFDFFPVLLFFVAFKFGGIYAATSAAILASIAQIAWVKFHGRKVDGMLWVSLVIILVFGGATLLLHDETFIKWKPTVLYWLFAAILLFSTLFMGRNPMGAMLGEKIQLPPAAWHKMNLAWGGFFAFMGAANLYVAFHYSLDTWVNFKLFGGMGLMLVFTLLQGLMLAPYLKEQEEKS